ncbi:MAG TPA: hypothetical protein VFZ78_08405 [Flavisolibacter sp.]
MAVLFLVQALPAAVVAALAWEQLPEQVSLEPHALPLQVWPGQILLPRFSLQAALPFGPGAQPFLQLPLEQVWRHAGVPAFSELAF